MPVAQPGRSAHRGRRAPRGRRDQRRHAVQQLIVPRAGAQQQDESTSSLLESLWQRLDDPYAAARAEHEADGTRPGVTTKLLSGFVALLLGAGLAGAIGQLRIGDPERETARAALIEQIEAATGDANLLQQENQEIGAQLSAERSATLSDTGLAERLERLERAAGTTPVDGRGIVVTLNDDPAAVTGAGDPRSAEDTANRVQDQDLQTVVNALFACGAQAVAINGHRFTSLSAIRGAGGAIMVNYTPLTAPYEVAAVGGEDPGNLRRQFLASDTFGYLKVLERDYAIASGVSQPRAVTVPAAEMPAFRHADTLSTADGSEVTE